MGLKELPNVFKHSMNGMNVMPLEAITAWYFLTTCQRLYQQDTRENL
jgi:hypothetical protein